MKISPKEFIECVEIMVENERKAESKKSKYNE
jgi:hypothetical protein